MHFWSDKFQRTQRVTNADDFEIDLEMTGLVVTSSGKLAEDSALSSWRTKVQGEYLVLFASESRMFGHKRSLESCASVFGRPTTSEAQASLRKLCVGIWQTNHVGGITRTHWMVGPQSPSGGQRGRHL